MLADLQRRLQAAEASTAEACGERDELQALLKARSVRSLREHSWTPSHTDRAHGCEQPAVTCPTHAVFTWSL